MPRRAPRLTVLVVLLLGVFALKTGCSRKTVTKSGVPLTPTRGHGYTPLPKPPTPTFVPGLPTPPPDLPG